MIAVTLNWPVSIRERKMPKRPIGVVNGAIMLSCVGVARLFAAGTNPSAHTVVADLVLKDARIYTAAGPVLAEALAARNGRIIFVGTAADLKPYIGPETRLISANGHLVVPGLVDSHLHPADIADLDVCDLKSKALSLRQLSAAVRDCLDRYHTAPGMRLLVHQWNLADGNQPDADYPTLRAALDKASTTREIQLLGNDGHHGGFNSLALANARNNRGVRIGISKSSLQGEFAPYASLIGIDASGEPNGTVNEDARYTINPRSMMYVELEAILRKPELIPQRLNSVGITAIMDAMADPYGLPLWDKLLKHNQLTVRATLAQFYDPSRTRTANGEVDYDGLVASAMKVRAKYAGNPLLRADFIKLFADGVIEADPLSQPPTLGNAAVLSPYLQPIFATDSTGHATVTGYVDTQSPVCAAAREHMDTYQSAAATAAFVQAQGFHPAQCLISSGRLAARTCSRTRIRKAHAPRRVQCAYPCDR